MRAKILLLLCCVCLASHAQDIIVKAENDTVQCKILQVSDESVRYQTLNNGVLEQHTLPRKYVLAYALGENQSNHDATAMPEKSKLSSFRLAIAGGYARRLGKILKTNDPAADQVSRDLANGFALDTEIQYYFNDVYGMALNVNYVRTYGEGQNVHVQDMTISDYRETQHILFVGPAFAMRYDTRKWLITSSLGLGPLFYTDKMLLNRNELKGTNVSFGMNVGLGAEYKLSSHLAAGLKLSYTVGSVNSLKVNGQKMNFEDPFSLSTLMISAYASFRTR